MSLRSSTLLIAARWELSVLVLHHRQTFTKFWTEVHSPRVEEHHTSWCGVCCGICSHGRKPSLCNPRCFCVVDVVRLKVYRWTVAEKKYMSLECAYMDECVCVCASFSMFMSFYVCVTVQDKWGSVVGCVCVYGAVLVCWSGVEWCDVQVTDGWTEVVRSLRHHLQTEQKQSWKKTFCSFYVHLTHELNCIIFTEELFIFKS